MSRALSIPPDAAARMKMLISAKTKSQGIRDETLQESVEPHATFSPAAHEKADPEEPPSDPSSSDR